MGFKVEINSILRSDDYPRLEAEDICAFEKAGSRLFFDDIPIWLTKMNWTALAEIRIVSQTRVTDKVSGQFKVLHVYTSEEQKTLTEIFLRMFGW